MYIVKHASLSGKQRRAERLRVGLLRATARSFGRRYGLQMYRPADLRVRPVENRGNRGALRDCLSARHPAGLTAERRAA